MLAKKYKYLINKIEIELAGYWYQSSKKALFGTLVKTHLDKAVAPESMQGARLLQCW